jgi:hypothetical protein
MFRTQRWPRGRWGGLSPADALLLCELLANERAALRWLQRFIDERCHHSRRSPRLRQRLPNFDTANDTAASKH